jgi:hypothetical protein
VKPRQYVAQQYKQHAPMKLPPQMTDLGSLHQPPHQGHCGGQHIIAFTRSESAAACQCRQAPLFFSAAWAVCIQEAAGRGCIGRLCTALLSVHSCVDHVDLAA